MARSGIHSLLVYRAKALKGSTNASPKRTPTKKANKTPALLDPARLRPPQLKSGAAGEQGRRNMSLGIIQQQHEQQNRRTDLDNEDDDPFRIDSLDVTSN